ncbi:hypothetical protein T439DRAFT_57928 [Meredithblackwellia eburnea MCA 4105]
MRTALPPAYSALPQSETAVLDSRPSTPSLEKGTYTSEKSSLPSQQSTDDDDGFSSSSRPRQHLLYCIPSETTFDEWFAYVKEVSSQACAGKLSKAHSLVPLVPSSKEEAELNTGQVPEEEEWITDHGRVVAKLSTEVYGDERGTSSFVWTTRPIVNPGGWTIGTLTGYVNIKPTPTSQPTTAPSIPSPTELPELEGWETHLRQKRGFMEDWTEEEEQQAVFPSPTTLADGSELSYSIERNGDTTMYVKTTRPIVNPGGYIIGTLDGAYVRVSKYEAPKPAATKLPIVVQHHEELRRRGLVDGDDGAAL